MPPKYGGGVQCYMCGKSVYKAEEDHYDGKMFHKLCAIAYKKELTLQDRDRRHAEYTKEADIKQGQ